MANKELKTLNFGDGNVYYPLPIISESDNNKVLMVVDGEWDAVTIVNAEEVAY